MTHHPNTPASRNEGEPCKRCHGKGVVEDGQLTHSTGGILYECGPIQCVKDCPDCNGVGKILASRTEQAAPSVASGVADDAALLAWGERHRIGADLKRLRWAYEDATSLAAPGAAIAARGQDADPVLASAYERDYLKAIKESKRWAEMIPEIRGDYSAESVIALLGGLVVASRQEAPAASAVPKCTCCGCGGCKSCLNGRNRCPKHSAARSPATVAQPVDYLRDAGDGVHEFVGKHERGAFPVYRAAQPRPSQGCGGDGGSQE